MADLTRIERLRLERALDMGEGYVLDFSNPTFSDFFLDHLDVDIGDIRYLYRGRSKANRMRAFWELEDNSRVAGLLEALFNNWDEVRSSGAPDQPPTECLDILRRLSRSPAASGSLNHEAPDAEPRPAGESVQGRRDLGDPKQLRQAMREHDVSPILQRFGAWAVTTYGIECLEQHYPIDLMRVDESDRVSHMRQKRWVKMVDFDEALDYARDLKSKRELLSAAARPLRIFLCHGKEDKPKVRALRDQLLALGTRPWIDEEDLLPGQNWRVVYTIVGGVFLAVLLFYGVWFFGPLSSKGSTWAQFGDYFGGVLNPVVGLAALIALLWTLKLQREELKTSIDELRKTAEAATAQARTAEQQAEIMIRSARVQGLAHIERWLKEVYEPATARLELVEEVTELRKLLEELKRQGAE